MNIDFWQLPGQGVCVIGGMDMHTSRFQKL